MWYDYKIEKVFKNDNVTILWGGCTNCHLKHSTTYKKNNQKEVSNFCGNAYTSKQQDQGKKN